MFFKGQANDYINIVEQYKDRLSDKMSIGVAGQSVAISMRVPKLAPLEKVFEEEQEKVDYALECLIQLSMLLSDI